MAGVAYARREEDLVDVEVFGTPVFCEVIGRRFNLSTSQGVTSGSHEVSCLKDRLQSSAFRSVVASMPFIESFQRCGSRRNSKSAFK